jgi:hypothetical protein
VCPLPGLPPVSGGRGTLAGEKGVGRVPIPTRGIHCGTLYMYVLCAYIYIYLRKRSNKFKGTSRNINPLHKINTVISYSFWKYIVPYDDS